MQKNSFLEESIVNYIVWNNGPLVKTSYYAKRVEFQVRGCSHIHSFIWILDVSKLTKESKQEYIQWIDSIIRTDITDPASEAELFQLVRTFQVHRYSDVQKISE